MQERRDHSAIRLSIEGSLLTFVVGSWLWWVVNLGAQAMVVERPPSGGEDLSGYVLACPDVQGAEEGIGSVGGDDSAGCLREVRPNMGTSRQPGGTYRAGAARRQLARTSENLPTTHSAE